MVDIIQPLDFLGRMGGPANLPNLIGDASAITAQRDQQAATIDALRSRAMAEQAQAAQQIEQQQRAQAYQQSLRGHLENPSAGSAANLSLQFPEYAKQINDAYALQDGAKRDGELRLKSAIYSRAHAGDWGAAGTELERYITAAKDAGEDVSDEEAMLSHLNSGDPARQKMALGILGYDLATIVGPDKWADFHGNKVVGNALVGNTGDVKYQAPKQGSYQLVDVLDEYGVPTGRKRSLNTAVGDVPGGTGSAARVGDNFPAAQAFVASVEGGIGPVESRGNQSKWGVDTGANPEAASPNWTQADSERLLHEKYWGPSGAAEIADPALATAVYDTAVNFGVDSARSMLKASSGDVEKLLAMRDTRYKSIAARDPEKRQFLNGWLDRNEKLRAQTGGATSRPAGPSQVQLAKRYGAPATGYQWKPDGSGQTFIKGGPADPDASRTGGKRQLPAGEIEKLANQAETVAQMADLSRSFAPAYSGIGSRVGNFRAGLGFGNPSQNAQHDWWQGMEAFDNVVRNQLFGASLTAGEQAAWERTTVTPNMDADRIKSNLARREVILKRALDRKIKTFNAAGYKADIATALGGAPAETAPDTGGGWSIRRKGLQ